MYTRFAFFADAGRTRADMIKKVPHKIDMGAVYTKEPSQKAYISKDTFKEVSREFVLDIDLTDYQEDSTIKSNCIDPADPEFCKSWKFMAVACRVRERERHTHRQTDRQIDRDTDKVLLHMQAHAIACKVILFGM